MNGSSLAGLLDGNAVGVHGDEVGGRLLTIGECGGFADRVFDSLDLFDDGVDAGIRLDGLL
jgi:hypothetical protein